MGEKLTIRDKVWLTLGGHIEFSVTDDKSPPDFFALRMGFPTAGGPDGAIYFEPYFGFSQDAHNDCGEGDKYCHPGSRESWEAGFKTGIEVHRLDNLCSIFALVDMRAGYYENSDEMYFIAGLYASLVATIFNSNLLTASAGLGFFDSEEEEYGVVRALMAGMNISLGF